MNDCLFCKIIAGDIPSTKVFEDDQILAFRDINPMAPTHILVIPKQHIGGVDEITPENSAVVAHIFEMIAVIAKEEGLTGGYRVVSNIGEDGGHYVDLICWCEDLDGNIGQEIPATVKLPSRG